MSRVLSYSEIQTAMTCQARHAFAYTGHLTGGETLKRRQMKSILSNGRAWGAAVAAWHASEDPKGLFSTYGPGAAQMAAHGALLASYAHDVKEQQELGVTLDPESQVDREDWMGKVLNHYMLTSSKLRNLTRLEDELNVPIPSRGGKRGSSKYRFQGYLDGFSDDDGFWIVEFKLRESLTPVEVISLSRQIRWYAWAISREFGSDPVGVIVDERLAAFPKPPKMINAQPRERTCPLCSAAPGNPCVKEDGKPSRSYHDERKGGLSPSHDKAQLTTPEWYIAVCQEHGVEPVQTTIDKLAERQWQQRVPIRFHAGELAEAGEELVSAAKTVRDLDSGERYPVRNTQPQLCRSCRWREACAAPDERLYLETLFDYTVPKRLREPMEAKGS